MQRHWTTFAAAAILAASTSLVCAQSPTAADSISSKTLSGGSEGSSGGSGAGPAKDQDMKAGSADSGNNAEAMTGPRDNTGATMPAQQAPNQGVQGREPNTGSPPKHKE